jgi:hypothetical protein
MVSVRAQRAIAFLLIIPALLSPVCPRGHAQAALFMEGADGISAALDTTGHEAVYFARICAATPLKLRRCRPGELGAVIARYKGVGGYDWLATPLLPYLYSVEAPAAVPARVDHKTVHRLRIGYHDAHLLSLGKDVPEGGRIQRGWNQLVGAAYERNIYAFRFRTTEEQDDALIARMNAGVNRTRFNIVFRNCADFAAGILNFYFPHSFGRRILPDAGIVTPRQVAYELARYARSHPEAQLTVLKIPQVPGYRRQSRTNQCIAAALIVTGEVLPLAVIAPYAATGVLADYLVWGRCPLALAHAQILTPENLAPLTLPDGSGPPSSALAQTTDP